MDAPIRKLRENNILKFAIFSMQNEVFAKRIPNMEKRTRIDRNDWNGRAQ